MAGLSDRVNVSIGSSGADVLRAANLRKCAHRRPQRALLRRGRRIVNEYLARRKLQKSERIKQPNDNLLLRVSQASPIPN